MEDNLEAHFNKVMKCDHIPLLSDFETYKKFLPVREVPEGSHLKLYTLEHWTCDEDMDLMVARLEKK